VRCRRWSFVLRGTLVVGVLCSTCACRTLVVVVDIGLDADGAIEHLRRQLAIVEIIDKLDGRSRPIHTGRAEPGSELAALAEAAPDAPVNLLLSVRAGLTAARGALDQIASLLGHNLPTASIVLQALLRTALLGAGRVVFALAPAEPGQRQRNVRVVLRQEGAASCRASTPLWWWRVAAIKAALLVYVRQHQLKEVRPVPAGFRSVSRPASRSA